MVRKPSPAPSVVVPIETGVVFRWPLYLASFFFPFAGIVIALLLIGSDSRPERGVARVCLWIGFIFWVLLPAFLLFLLAVGALLALGSLFSGLMAFEP